MRGGLWLFLFCALASATWAEAPAHGLMWNKTGLPAVFPLQVKTAHKVDTQVTLIDASSGQRALAAYIEGGRFFKVLVPPGEFVLEFQQVQKRADAIDEAAEAQVFFLDQALTFAVRNGVKVGHSVDLTDPATGIVLKESFICQRYRVTRPSRPLPPFGDDSAYATRLRERGEIAVFPNPNTPERLAQGVTRPIVETDFAPYFSRPEYDLRSNPC